MAERQERVASSGCIPTLGAEALRTLPLEKDLRKIADSCGHNWKSLLSYVGLKNRKIQELKSDENTLPDACFQGLVFWLGRNADESDPVNWSTLLTAMEEAGMTGDAQEWRQKIIERCAASLDKPSGAGQSGNVKTPTPEQEEPSSNVPTSATAKDVDKKNETGRSGSKRSQPPSGDQQLQPDRHSSSLRVPITSKSDFVRFLNHFLPNLLLLSVVLEIESLAADVLNDRSNATERCLNILGMWLSATANPTWELFCSLLQRSDQFNHVRSLIETACCRQEFSSGQEQTKTLCDNPHIQRLKRHVMNRYKYGNLNPAESAVRVEYIRLAVLEAPQCRHDEDEEDRDEEGGRNKLEFFSSARNKSAKLSRQLEFLERFRTCGNKDGKVQNFVEADDLLKPTTCHKKPLGNRTKVVYGQPGMGKTTLLTHICRSLTLDKPIQSSYALVLYFPLREKEVSSAKTLSDLLSYYATADSELDLSALRRAIVNSGDKEVLFIFDGADEVQGLLSSEERGVFQDLLEGRTLPQADVIVSSRPGGLPQLIKQNMAIFYEIHGLDFSSVDKYIKEFFKSSPKKGERLWKELQSRDDLMGGAHIPMNLLIFCHILGKGGLPSTLTECYKQYIVQVYNRKSPERKWTDFDDCPEDVKELLLSLGRLAYSGMVSTSSPFVFEEKQVKEAFKTSSLDTSAFKGLLHEHHSPFAFISRSTFNFSHATQQELFCAYYISQRPIEEQAEFLRSSMSRPGPKFMVLRFYAGLTRLADEQVVDTVLHEPGFFGRPFLSNDSTTDIIMYSEYDNPGLLHLFHFLYESQNSQLTQSVARRLDGKAIKFSHFLTSLDTRVIAHCLRENRWFRELSFDFSTASASDVLSCTCEILMSASVNRIHKLTLRLEDCHLTQTSASRLMEGLTRTEVVELVLVVSHADMSAIAAIFEAPILKGLELYVRHNFHCVSNSDSEVAQLQSSARNIRIKKLDVMFTPPSLLLPVVKGLAANTCVETLILRINALVEGGDDGVGQALAAACTTNTTLKDIELDGVSPLPLMKVLCSREVPLERLAITFNGCCVSDSDLEVAQSSARNIRIKKLEVCSPPSLLLSVVKGLAANNFVEELILRGACHHLFDGGSVAQILATACTTNTTLKDIELEDVSPLSLMEVLCSREVPLDRLAIRHSHLRSREDPTQCPKEALETLAKNMKVKMFEEWDIFQHRATESQYWKALADGLSRNKFIREVDLIGVPDDLKDYISAKLSTLETVTLNHCDVRALSWMGW